MKKTKVLVYNVEEGRTLSPTETVLMAKSLEELFVKFEVINYKLRTTSGASFIDFKSPESEKKEIDWYNSLTDEERFNLYYKGVWQGKPVDLDLAEELVVI